MNNKELDLNKQLSKVGVLLNNENRSATMVVQNEETVILEKNEKSKENYTYMSIGKALSTYPWLKDYSFKAVPRDYDDITLECSKYERPVGFFIHIPKGVKVSLPCQAAMFILSDLLKQIIHNIVILEEDSELELITGCTSDALEQDRTHIAVEEYYIGKNAKLKSTMIHSWGSNMKVFPRSAAIVSENGRYENNYISIQPAKVIKSNPQTYLNGENASAKYLTVVLGIPGSTIDTGGNVFLNAEGTSAELLHRGVCTGGIMHQGGLLIGHAPCKAHVDCAGMILDNSHHGFITSIPGLESHHADARMSHEASIGKIAPENVEYLMSRGMDEMEAISLLIRGFLGSDIEGLGENLDQQISEIAEIAGHGED
ncbi:MAG: SufD family Fe-S cluster assembly protein [Tenericutes bacterium]|nr:SufD family Fe-S cluster assembly protein [Mycoplasmatota bacterium]